MGGTQVGGAGELQPPLLLCPHSPLHSPLGPPTIAPTLLPPELELAAAAGEGLGAGEGDAATGEGLGEGLAAAGYTAALRLLAATVKPLEVKREVRLLDALWALASMAVGAVAGTVMTTAVLLAVSCSRRRLAAALMLTQLAGATPNTVATPLVRVAALAVTAAACRTVSGAGAFPR